MSVEPDERLPTSIPEDLMPSLNPEKLSGYVLNASSTKGRSKARLFGSLLDIGPEDADMLREQLLDGVWTGNVTSVKPNQYGLRYQVEIPITGNNERTRNVDTVWQVESDGITLKFLTVRTIEKD